MTEAATGRNKQQWDFEPSDVQTRRVLFWLGTFVAGCAALAVAAFFMWQALGDPDAAPAGSTAARSGGPHGADAQGRAERGNPAAVTRAMRRLAEQGWRRADGSDEAPER